MKALGTERRPAPAGAPMRMHADPSTHGSESDRRRAKLSRPKRDTPRIYTAALLVLFIALWEWIVSLGVLDVTFISKPSRIVMALIRLAADDRVRSAMAETLVAIAISFVLAAVVGVILGMVLGLNRLLRDAYLPFVVAFLGIPKSVFLPLFILFFGLGILPGIAFGFVLAFIQVIVNVVGGIDSIDRVHYRMAKAYGASPVALFRHVVLPGAAPGIFAGLWHAIRNAFLGVVIAQLFVSNIGVGYLVRLYTSDFRVDDALALIFFIAVLIILAGTAWATLERRISVWREVPTGSGSGPTAG